MSKAARAVHWLGAGLSSTPGIQAIAESGSPLVVWNRTLEKAQEAIAPYSGKKGVEARSLNLEAIVSSLGPVLNPGDVVVSMLPATQHVQVAEVCLKHRAHLVTTSYISDAMRALDAQARASNLSFINEAGLDPGIDHLFARELMARFNELGVSQAAVKFTFKSLCGGFPENPGEFRYKFSWSPLGVLRALRNRAQYIKMGATVIADQPWKELSSFEYRGEKFETYPNRDSTTYLEEYGFHQRAQVQHFIRGTIRPDGWSKAWEKVFDRVENGTDHELVELSEKLWTKYKYSERERDRVLLYVSLEAHQGEKRIWSGAFSLNEFGSGKQTAMARTVSFPATFAVESVLAGRAPIGVSGAPLDRTEALLWLRKLRNHDIAVYDGNGEPVRF